MPTPAPSFEPNNVSSVSVGPRQQFNSYIRRDSFSPLFFLGDALSVLRALPSECIDFCMTSPPYWGKRQYENGGIGLEIDFRDYLCSLVDVFGEVKRVIKQSGSFWLNIGDSYQNKHLLGIPWRIALELSDEQGWILRNSVIWNKVKGGPDNSEDRLRNVHENIFHFVKAERGYYYDIDAIRSAPNRAKVTNGAVISATGVTGIRYRRQIEISTALSAGEKRAAFDALESILEGVRRGEVSDFRMIIRNQQRTTHSDSESVSGRAKELKERGFYFLRYNPLGSKPSDVWDVLPEDTQKREGHFAPYPQDLCKLPIIATCPPSGIVLDPFCGTGTTMLAARNLGRKSIGIDISEAYLRVAEDRCRSLL